MGIDKIVEEVMQTKSKYVKQKILVAYDDDKAIQDINVIEVERELKKSHRSVTIKGEKRVENIYRLKNAFKIEVLLKGQDEPKTLSTTVNAEKIRLFRKFETAHQFIVDNLPNVKEYRTTFLDKQQT